MYRYEMIKEKDLENMTKEHLAYMYNDAVEAIWLMRIRINELQEENDSIWEAYDEISNKLYG